MYACRNYEVIWLITYSIKGGKCNRKNEEKKFNGKWKTKDKLNAKFLQKGSMRNNIRVLWEGECHFLRGKT
jgi:hypothetical protein